MFEQNPGRLGQVIYLGVGVALLAIVIHEVDFARVGVTLGNFGILGLLVVLALYAGAFTLDSITWTMALPTVPLNGRWIGRTWLVRMAGEAYNNVVPAAGLGGEPLKAMLLSTRYGVSVGSVVPSLVLARTINLVSLCIFLAVGFALMLDAHNLPPGATLTAGLGLGAAIAATLAFLLLQRLRGLSRAATRFAAARPSATLARIVAHLQAFDDRLTLFYVRHPGRFALAVVLALANWLLGVAEIYYVMQFLQVPVSWAEAYIIEAVTQMVRLGTFFIPLSLGAQEGAFVVVVGAMTGSSAVGFSVAVVKRARELIWTAAGFAVALALGLRPQR